MTRPASPTLISAATAASVSPFMAAELIYPDGPVRVTSLPIHVEFMGHTWHGTGAMGRITQLEEGSENRSYGFALELSGIPGNWGEYLRAQDVQGGLVTIYLGFANSEWQPVSTPEVITVGRMDCQDVQAGENTFVRVNCEGPNVDWERPRVRRCTDVDQTTRTPGDRFFKFTAAMRNFRESWGRSG
jgi:hypothetical protein